MDVSAVNARCLPCASIDKHGVIKLVFCILHCRTPLRLQNADLRLQIEIQKFLVSYSANARFEI
jgi:hypothetical protein